MTERVEFLVKFIREPRKIGSITPSSVFLTRKMLARLPWNELGTIVELGAGTGVFTKYIADNKKTATEVVVIEQDFRMRESLRERYPSFYYGARAEQLAGLLNAYHLPPADCIVSGLPFAAFDVRLRERILTAVTQSLQQDGVFIAFQYSLQMRKILQQHFSEVRIGFVPLNMPPAFVYYCKK
ncbi:methyltransferase|uniref:Phospholipid N-methyltransferase n=1 Tax=Dendrosporobacter quercicolus TaxID=146817 RepID=A0A1G9XDY0_9FIRM|nr:methyltransferase [Dendrosporobacter quercicolus]NSL49697.1 methyltransferase [Dendrosporobacter quercicolus DSM 1736]SDM94741.1 Phospholipid N-methyltransferase [Dendrosporobacter quercicolus]